MKRRSLTLIAATTGGRQRSLLVACRSGFSQCLALRGQRVANGTDRLPGVLRQRIDGKSRHRHPEPQLAALQPCVAVRGNAQPSSEHDLRHPLAVAVAGAQSQQRQFAIRERIFRVRHPRSIRMVYARANCAVSSISVGGCGGGRRKTTCRENKRSNPIVQEASSRRARSCRRSTHGCSEDRQGLAESTAAFS